MSWDQGVVDESGWDPRSVKARVVVGFVVAGVALVGGAKLKDCYDAFVRHETLAQAEISMRMEKELAEAFLHKSGLIVNGQAETQCESGTCVRFSVFRYEPHENIEAVVQYGEGETLNNTVAHAPLPEDMRFPWLGKKANPKWRRFRYPAPSE